MSFPAPPPTPTADEIQKIALYWRWVEDMGCEHPTFLLTAGEPVRCGECNHPIQVMSDIQIEALRTART